MWTLKFDLGHFGCIYSPKCERFKVIDEIYPINYYSKGKDLYLTAVHLAKGEEKRLRAYFNALRRDKRVRKISGDSSMFYALALQRRALGDSRFMFIVGGFLYDDPAIIEERAKALRDACAQ